MHETEDDLGRLEQLLATSYARAGDHLRAIHTEAARVDARRLVAELDGMRVLVVATVTADGRPLTGPVDGWFYRGAWYFGTDAAAVRARHLAVRPAVSATYVRGEDFVCTVHGYGRRVDAAIHDDGGLAQLLRGAYGDDWDDWGAGAPYWRIVPDRVLAADVSVLAAAG